MSTLKKSPGSPGITWIKNTKGEMKPIVKIVIKGERRYIGMFPDLAAAEKARAEAIEKYGK